MLKKYKDLIECANAITDEDILDTDWMMPSDIDPFLNELFKCIYNYRHPQYGRNRPTREEAKALADQLVVKWRGRI